MATDTGSHPTGLDARERALWILHARHRGLGLVVATPCRPEGWNAAIDFGDGLFFESGSRTIRLDPSGAVTLTGLERRGAWLLPRGSAVEPAAASAGELRGLVARSGELCGLLEPGTGTRIEIELTSDCVCQSWLRRLVKGFLSPLGFAGRDVYRVQLAVDEALTNIIRHAYGTAGRRPIDFAMEVRGGQLEVLFVDAGERKPDVPNLHFELPAETRPGGRGLFILREVFDQVDFDTSGPHTRLRLTRRLPDPEP